MEHFLLQLVLVWSSVVPVSTFQHTRLILESGYFLLLFPMPGMSGIWYCFVGGLNFQRWLLIFNVKRNAYWWWNPAKFYWWTHCRFGKYTNFVHQFFAKLCTYRHNSTMNQNNHHQVGLQFPNCSTTATSMSTPNMVGSFFTWSTSLQ